MIPVRLVLVFAAARAAVGQSVVPMATESVLLELPSVAPETVEEARRIMRAGSDPRFPYADDTSKACDYWHDDLGDLACKDIPDWYFLSPEEWNHWNPSVKADCSGWVPGHSYCVAAFGDMPGSEQPEPEPTTTAAAQTTTEAAPEPATTTTQANAPPPVTTTATPTTTKPSNGIETPSPLQLEIVSNCNKFVWVNNGDTCDAVARRSGVTTQQIKDWNPSVGINCSGLWSNAYACVTIIGFTPTPTQPSNGITTPTPLQREIVSNCNKFDWVNNDETCDVVAHRNGITAQQLQTWNPSVGSNCAGLWSNAYACVSIIGFTPTPTQPGNGIATPSPLQREVVANCNKFDWVEDNETCDTVARRNGISSQQLQAWNPSVGNTCTGLWSQAYACVSIIGFTPTPTQPGNGGQTPQPTQQRLVDNCAVFTRVEDYETCDSVARRNGITTQQFVSFNPSVGSTCGGLWARAYACVGLIRSFKRWQA